MKKTRIISLCNLKGGVGKSTGVVNLAGALAESGKKVLVVDMDPQANASTFLGIQGEGRTISEVMRGDLVINDVMRERSKNLWVIPSSRALDETQQVLAATPGRELILRDEMSGVEGFDYILIDCAPRLDLLLVNVLSYVSEVFLAVQTEPAALEGVASILDTLKKVQKRLNAEVSVTGVICMMYDARVNLHRDVVAEIQAAFGPKLFKTMVPRRIAFAEAGSHGKTISEYAPKGAEREVYVSLAKEVMKGGKR